MTRSQWLVPFSLVVAAFSTGCAGAPAPIADPVSLDGPSCGVGDYEVSFTSSRGRPGPHPPPSTQLRPKVGSVGKDGERLVAAGAEAP